MKPLNPSVLVAANLFGLALPLAYLLIPAVRVRMIEQNSWPFERITALGRAYGRAAHSAAFTCLFMMLFVDWLTFFDTRTSFRNVGVDVLLSPLLGSTVLFFLTPLFAWPRWALYPKFRDDKGLVQEGMQWLRDRRQRLRHRAGGPRHAAQGSGHSAPELRESPADSNVSDDD